MQAVKEGEDFVHVLEVEEVEAMGTLANLSLTSIGVEQGLGLHLPSH